MNKTIFVLLILVRPLFSSCEKNPATPSPDSYELPTKVYTGALTGEELLFYPTDAWLRYAGIYSADAEGQNVHCLASYNPYGTASPTFLADHRVLVDDCYCKIDKHFKRKKLSLACIPGNFSRRLHYESIK